MTDHLPAVALLAAALAVFLVTFFLGRAFRGKWMLIFVVVMLIIGALTVFSLFALSSGANAGMGEALVLIFIWAPVFGIGLIGSAFGWITNRSPLVATLHQTPD